LHLAAYLAVGPGLYGLLPVGDGVRIWGLTCREWAALSWLFAGLFQGWIAVAWRCELYGGIVGTRFGPRGFRLFQVGFVLLGFCRFVPLVPLSMASARTLPLSRDLSWILIAATTPFILWALHTILCHLGFDRATGADHFFPEFRGSAPLKDGLFRYVNNPAYTVGLLALYHPGLLWLSAPGLVVAACHHALVWTHYYCTEKPDLEHIYGRR